MSRTKRRNTRKPDQKLKMLALYLPDKTIERIIALAEADGRRVGNMGRRLIEEALEHRGVELPQLATV